MLHDRGNFPTAEGRRAASHERVLRFSSRVFPNQATDARRMRSPRRTGRTSCRAGDPPSSPSWGHIVHYFR